MMKRARLLGFLFLASIAWTASGCGSKSHPDQDSDSHPNQGAPSAAVLDGGIVKIYLGQPGVVSDISKIEANERLTYSYWRLTAPADLTAPIEGTFDFSVVNSSVSYAEYFLSAPGCGPTSGPWKGQWHAGESGLSGSLAIAVQDGGNAIDVAYQFVYSGPLSTPCGNAGTLESTEHFSAPLVAP